ncbi:hypothetical protein [Actinoplanes sp. URMC 104]|uniref:hypothetical protein n=1 Tax=Actinoplanes sp. URMC 104 TaxID=3423409 RepID=UPI003F197985
MRPRALIAPARRSAALSELWSRVVKVRREWLDLATSCEPADHGTTEEALASIYARHGRPLPEFLWVPSPRAAIPYVRGLPTHDDLRAALGDLRPPPLASDIAAGLSRLRSQLESGYVEPPADRPAPRRKKGEPWPVLPAERAIESGIPFSVVLTQGVRDAVARSLGNIYLPIRAAAGPLPVGWYGHQDVGVVLEDVVRRAVSPGLGSHRGLESWATLNRSAGWWWPGEHRCVLSERPVVLLTEPVPGACHDEVRLVRAEYADGWTVRHG